MRLLYLFSAVVLVSSGSLGGCASGPPPMEELTRARTLVDQAEKAQAGRYAAADLQRAHDKLSAADAANQSGKYDVARRDAEAAAIDADVAAARASEAQALTALDEVQRGNETLRSETGRAGEAGAGSPPDLQAFPATTPAPAPQRDRLPPPDTGTPR